MVMAISFTVHCSVFGIYPSPQSRKHKVLFYINNQRTCPYVSAGLTRRRPAWLT